MRISIVQETFLANALLNCCLSIRSFFSHLRAADKATLVTAYELDTRSDCVINMLRNGPIKIGIIIETQKLSACQSISPFSQMRVSIVRSIDRVRARAVVICFQHEFEVNFVSFPKNKNTNKNETHFLHSRAFELASLRSVCVRIWHCDTSLCIYYIKEYTYVCVLQSHVSCKTNGFLLRSFASCIEYVHTSMSVSVCVSTFTRALFVSYFTEHAQLQPYKHINICTYTCTSCDMYYIFYCASRWYKLACRARMFTRVDISLY